ncbi:MAG TPA: hypothetical protein VM287_10860 [Egibacteraceae bacterium]|nr:hypothetical protein [Egibacteraceae bacterium]
MRGFSWSGNEPEALNNVELAEEFGAIWEDDELVHYEMDSLRWPVEHNEQDEYQTDND